MAKNDLNKLTASFVSGLRKYSGQDLPDGMPLTYPDGGGLSLVFDKNAKRFYWRMKYRFAGKEHRGGYGSYPEVSLAQARACRDRDRQLIAQGVDPIAQRKTEEEERRQQALTYEIVARQWHEQTTDNPKNHKSTLLRLEKHVFPAIGRRPFAEVRRRELSDVLRAVAQEQNERTGEGKVFTARKLASYMSQIDDYGEARGLIEGNRAQRLTRALPPLPNREGFIAVLDPSGVAQMLQVITTYYNGDKGTPYMRAAIRLVPYLFLRSSALCGMRWQEIDFEKSLLVIEAEPMRTKWTEGKRIFPLPSQVTLILKKLSELRAPGEFVFPSWSAAGHIQPERLEQVHRVLMDSISKEHVPHSWRKVFSTHARDKGAPRVLVETQLAHSEGGQVELAYNKAVYVEPRRTLIQWYADYLDALETGKSLPAFPTIEGFSAFDA